MYRTQIIAAIIVFALTLGLAGCAKPVAEKPATSADTIASTPAEPTKTTSPEPATPDPATTVDAAKTQVDGNQNPQPSKPVTTVHTPAKGTSERQALMDAARKAFWHPDTKFVVYSLYSNGTWAIGTLKPESVEVDPAFYIWHKTNGSWTCINYGTEWPEEYARGQGMPQDLFSKWASTAN